MGIISCGTFVLVCMVTFTYVESLTCGQTVCLEKEYCCEDRKDCCCASGPSGFSFHCNSSTSTTVGLRWYEILVIVVFIVGICAGVAVCFVLYRRRRRNVYGSI